MSRNAVSCEHFASVAHLDVVSLPSKSIEQTVDHHALPVVNRCAGMGVRRRKLIHRILCGE